MRNSFFHDKISHKSNHSTNKSQYDLLENTNNATVSANPV